MDDSKAAIKMPWDKFDVQDEELPRLPIWAATYFITYYMADGLVVEYNLMDPTIPLPRFRSLTKQGCTK